MEISIQGYWNRSRGKGQATVLKDSIRQHPAWEQPEPCWNWACVCLAAAATHDAEFAGGFGLGELVGVGEPHDSEDNRQQGEEARKRETQHAEKLGVGLAGGRIVRDKAATEHGDQAAESAVGGHQHQPLRGADPEVLMGRSSSWSSSSDLAIGFSGKIARI